MSEQDNQETGQGVWRKLSQREREQIRFLLTALAVVVLFVILASLVAGTVVSLI